MPSCPACRAEMQSQGRRLVCAACGGVMVTEEDLTEMLRMMTPNDLRTAEDHLRGLGPGPRACPRCSIPMEAVQLESETLDRCPTHGFWFDVHELAKALDPANDFEAAHQRKVVVADVLEYGELGAVIAHIVRKRREP